MGGAEFRLLLLIGLLGFGALEAVILNKAMILVLLVAIAILLLFGHEGKAQVMHFITVTVNF